MAPPAIPAPPAASAPPPTAANPALVAAAPLRPNTALPMAPPRAGAAAKAKGVTRATPPTVTAAIVPAFFILMLSLLKSSS